MLTVAVDTGPLHGPRTGVGHAVAWYLDELATQATTLGVETTPYVLSMRASVEEGERRLPVPAALGLRWWAKSSRPKVDRWLGTPDVVHGTNYVVPPSSAPRVVSVYDCWFLDHPADAHPDVQLSSAVLLRSLNEGATALVSSQASADRLRHHVDTDRIEVVHLGLPVLDAEPDAAGAPDPELVERLGSDRFVLALGTIERRKNLPHLVRAFGHLHGEAPGCSLVIAGGDGDDRFALDAAIAELPAEVAERVVLAGRVTAATKRWLLSQAALLSYVSLDEGFGFPILEAQQASVPILASTAGSSIEVGGDGCRYVDPSDVDGLANALVSLLDDEAAQQALVEHGTRNLERFSWSDCVRSTVEIYRRVADR